MTEIEEVKAQIKVLQSKLSFLEELEKTKSPVEEAFKDWMGVYPPTNPSVDNIFDIRWRAFQKGYDAAYEEKVEEKPEELKTLYQMFYKDEWTARSCREFCDIVEKWMSQYSCDTNKWDEDYKCGFLDCIDVLRKKLK